MTAAAPEETRLRLDGPVRCRDGKVGHLADVVIEPRERRVTHLVVEDRGGEARLVAAEHLVPGGHGRVVRLSCSKADVEASEPIRSLVHVGAEDFPGRDGNTDVGVEEAVLMPSFADLELGGYGGFAQGYAVAYDRIPTGSAELRRTSPVVSADGSEVGHVGGFLVVGARVTRVVVESDLYRSSRPVELPIDSVEAIETDRITLRLLKDDLDSFGRRSRWLPFL